jgi:steroid delta-isomerase-like uncharacterized protein
MTQTTVMIQPAGVAAGLMEAWNAHDLEGVMSFYAPDYEGVDVGQATPEHGLEGKRQAVLRYLLAFPDLHFAVESTVVQDQVAVVSWIARGTHCGFLMNIPPTGRTIMVRGVSILTMQGGKVVDAVYVWDVAGMLRAIGLLPEL